MKQLFVGVLFIICVACSSAQRDGGDASKYEFENLETVNSINNFTMNSWRVVDDSSVIIRTSPRTSYLVVLSSPIFQLQRAQGLLVSSTSGRVLTGFDSVSIARDPMLKSPIRKIYKLQGKEQIAEVIEQITAGVELETEEE